jgi:endoglucanase
VSAALSRRSDLASRPSSVAVKVVAFVLLAKIGAGFSRSGEPPSKAAFVRVRDSRLVLGEKPEEVRLRGVAFSPSASAVARNEDYEGVRRIGMNTVLLAMSYRTFYQTDAPDTYRPAGWEWIDSHVRLARDHGVFLVLFLLGVEGAQFVPGSEPLDYRIWKEDRLQERFLRLWKAIAERYSAEPQIAGFALFGEPVTSGSAAQWTRLAGRACRVIRSVDKNHAIFVERVYGENRVRREVSGIDLPPERAFPVVPDDNVVYMFYFFERDEYTHQFAPWRPELQKSIRYPDDGHSITYREGSGGVGRRFGFNRSYLEFYLKRQLEFGRAHRAPMFVWGGALKGCLTPEKGGLEWLADVVSLFEASRLQWALWAYRDDNFGIDDNEAVKRLLTQRLAPPATR